jgi:DNA-binding FadR family transcriptional regulator
MYFTMLISYEYQDLFFEDSDLALNPTTMKLRTGTNSNWRRIHGSVAHQLAVMIIGGGVEPGDALPNEEVLSAQLDVSRTAYREAMRILIAKGLVTSRPKVGTIVSPRSSWNLLDPDVLSWHLEVAPSPTFITSLFELRKIIEPASSALAAQHRTAQDVELLRGHLTAMHEAETGSPDALEADLAFHDRLIRASGNESLGALSSAIGSTLRWTVRLKLEAHPQVYQDSLPLHMQVFEAVERQDADAAFQLMSKLVDDALSETLQTLAELKL